MFTRILFENKQKSKQYHLESAATRTASDSLSLKQFGRVDSFAYSYIWNLMLTI